MSLRQALRRRSVVHEANVDGYVASFASAVTLVGVTQSAQMSVQSSSPTKCGAMGSLERHGRP